jgi:hypothetical protein
MNNINGGPGRRSGMASVDFYRRVPKDLTEVRSYFYAARHVVEAVIGCDAGARLLLVDNIVD